MLYSITATTLRKVYNDLEIREVKPTNKRQVLAVGDGVFVVVEPIKNAINNFTGKSFVGKCRFPPSRQGKQIDIRLGLYGKGDGYITIKKAKEYFSSLKKLSNEKKIDPREIQKIRKLSTNNKIQSLHENISKSSLKENKMNNSPKRYSIKKNDFKFWGHNCFSITNGHTVLIIDPWFSNSGAFFGSWFQYPKNHQFSDNILNLLEEGVKRYIFISHEHQDHYDKEFLTLIPKNVKIIIPNYSDKEFRNELSERFTSVIELEDNKEFSLDEDFNILLYIKDIGITHDASILVKTEEFVFFNQNDCKVFDRLSDIREKIDFYSVQFSGANWHPSNFDYTEEKKLNISTEKIQNKFRNILNALNELKPRYYLPAAGPAIFPFLDINYSLGKGNIFVHQEDLRDFLNTNGFKNILFLHPGESFESLSKEPIKAPSLDELELYKEGLKNKWIEIPNKLNRFLLEEQIYKRFSKIIDIKITNCPILIFNYGGEFNNDNSNNNKIFIDLQNKRLLDNFDYLSKFEEIVATERYFNLMCFEKWQNVYLTLRAKVFRKPDYLNNDINIFLFSDYSNIRNNFLSTNDKNKERIIVKNKFGECYLINKYCPHQKANLSKALIDDNNNLICPVHAWKFDLNNKGKDKRSNLTINSKKI